MNGFYRRLLSFYPAQHRQEFGREMLAVFQDVSADIEKEGFFVRGVFFAREFSGLLSGAILEHLHAFGVCDISVLGSTRRFNMRNGFRFPKSTAVLMTIILLGVIVAIRKGEAIANSLPHVNPQIGPIQAGHSTLLPPIAIFFAFFYALGLIGWVIVHALRKSGVYRLDEISGPAK